MTLKSGKVYSDIGTPSNTYGVDGDIYMQLDGLKTTYRKEGAVWVAVGSSLGAIPEFISGSGVPSSLLGADNQYYRNVENQDIYYKGGGIWSAIGNLQGLAFQSVLIQHGIGKDLSTPPNLINSGTLNSYLVAGEFYFTNTVADRPFNYGLMKVWRENSTAIYQLVQGAWGEGLATRYSGDGGATWRSWRYPANRDGDNTRTFKVANAVANDDAVRLEQLTSSELWGFNYTTYSVGPHAFTIPANKVIRVLLIGGGGGGGGIANDEYTGASSGSDGNASSIYPTGNASAFLLKANGGKAGNGVTTSNGDNGVYGTHGVPREVEINSLYEVVILSYQDGLLPINHTTASEIKHPTIKKLALTDYGQGGLGGGSGYGLAGSGSGGAFVEALIKNSGTAPLDLTIEVGAGGASSTGNYSNGQNGGHGICVVIY